MSKVSALREFYLNLAATQGSGVPSGAKGPGENELEASWKERWEEMQPLVTRVVKTKPDNVGDIRQTAEDAEQHAGEGNFAKALGSLTRLTFLLQQAGPPRTSNAPESGSETQSKVPKPDDELKEEVGRRVANKTANIPPAKQAEFTKKLSASVERSGALAEHLKAVMGSKTKVEFVTGDEHMGSGGAYYDLKTDTININKDDDPSRMADNLIWESCNAANKSKFETLDKEFSKSPQLADYGLAKAKIEFRTSLKYATLMEEQLRSLPEVQQKNFESLSQAEEKLQEQLRPLEQIETKLQKRLAAGSTPELVQQNEKLQQQLAPLREELQVVRKGLDKILPKSGRGQLKEFRSKAPTYFEETDPIKRQQMEDGLEGSFVDSPQDAGATHGKGTLSSAELYRWEKIVQGGVVSVNGYVKKMVYPDAGKNKPRGLDEFIEWTRANFPATDTAKKPRAFDQLLGHVESYFDDVAVDLTQWNLTDKMKQVALELAEGWNLPACPVRPPA